MNREILFRGKRVDNGKWIEGFYHNVYTLQSHSSDRKVTQHHIYSQDFDVIVNGDSVGQFTGKTDKNGNKIFEGDIVKWYTEFLVVKFGEYDVVEESYDIGKSFRTVEKFGWFGERAKDMPSKGIDLKLLTRGEVVGNIYDNPDIGGKK